MQEMARSIAARDGEESRPAVYGDLRRLRRVFIWFAVTALAGFAAGFAIVLSNGDGLFAVIIAAAMLPVAASLQLIRRDRLEASAVLLALTMFAALTALATMGLGIHHISNFAFAVVLLVSSMVTRKRTLIALTIVAIGCAAWLVFGELLGAYTPRPLTRSVPGDFFSATVIIVVTAVLARLLTETLLRNNLKLQHELTERKQAEAERIRLEAQLQQAQKMESVGRLAGGVAHDFNNMLSVILGNAELALDGTDHESPVRAYLQEISAAAGRSAGLTRQLLAFARKQAIVPRVLDLDATVEGMLKMLRRLIGEEIALAWLPGAGTWLVRLDPSQVDQLLANLCVNARDAISGVGTVTIQTSNTVLDEAWCATHAQAVPGEYVMISVSDNGCGMDQDTLDRLFEPFFTTKENGKGTGLGLATVYGIVKQNNGVIEVSSEPGAGSTFRIYLPRHAGDLEEPEPGRSKGAAPGNRETVLLVEDEPAVLRMVGTMLLNVGYSVLSTSMPEEAIRLAEGHDGDIRLLITDVIMPGMNGRELGRKLRARFPRMRCLFTSGYTADVMTHDDVPDHGANFLQKPYSMNALAAKVREMLDA